MLKKLLSELKSLAGSPVRSQALRVGDNLSIRSHGLSEVGLPEIEVADCPERLCEVASNLVLKIAAIGISEPASIKAGKKIGGRFVSPDQQLIEIFRLSEFQTDPALLRVVDLQDQSLGFPHKLVATHLCATAGSSQRDALRLLLVSVEVWPREKKSSNAALGDFELNPNNFWSWIDLGTTFSQSNQVDNAIAHWKTAICMWPRGGKLYANKILSKEHPVPGWGGKGELTYEFWRSVSDQSIKHWCAELEVEISHEQLEP